MSKMDIISFERVSIHKEGIKKTHCEFDVELKNTPLTDYRAEVAIQQQAIWRNKPSSKNYGAHSIDVSIEECHKPEKISFKLQLRANSNDSTDQWSFTVRALVIYYKAV